MRSEKGFTLIELMTVVSIIGVLAAMAFQAFFIYKKSGYYTVAETTLKNARTAIEAGINNPDNPAGTVALTSQTTPGQISDPSAAQLLPGLRLPKNVKFQVSYDPSCTIAACQSDFMQVNHCEGKEFTRYVRMGDGTETILTHLAGAGCP